MFTDEGLWKAGARPLVLNSQLLNAKKRCLKESAISSEHVSGEKAESPFCCCGGSPGTALTLEFCEG